MMISDRDSEDSRGCYDTGAFFRYGIQAAKDVKLSNIARTLKEEQALIKTEDRLSRNLDDEDFTRRSMKRFVGLGDRR